MLREMRNLVNKEGNITLAKKKIDAMAQSGKLSASFESIKGAPAFWKK